MRGIYILLLLIQQISFGQNITTFCGNGISASSVEGAHATATSITGAGGGVFDKNGNYYLTQGIGNSRISKISVAGTISTVAGTGAAGYSGDGGAATLAQLKYPNPPAVDSIGNIYIPDGNNNRLRKVDIATGIITTIAGNGTMGFWGDGGPATASVIYTPSCIDFDTKGNLYFVDYGNGRVRKIDNSGIISTVAGTGVAGYSGDGGPATAAQMNGVTAIKFDKIGNMYLSINGHNRIRKIDTFGIITTIAGNGTAAYSGDGIAATNAQFDPWWITVDDLNNIYIPDHYNNRVRKIDAAGIIHTVAGTSVGGYNGDGIPATSAQLNWPEGVTLDSCGNLYIADNLNARIRKIPFNSLCNPTLNSPKINSALNIVYPNPCYNTLNIENVSAHCAYTFLNTIGSVMDSGSLNEGSNTLSILHQPPGIYLLALTDGEGRRTVHKIVKE